MHDVLQIRVPGPVSLGHHLRRPSVMSQPGHDPPDTRGQVVGQLRAGRPGGRRAAPGRPRRFRPAGPRGARPSGAAAAGSPDCGPRSRPRNDPRRTPLARVSEDPRRARAPPRCVRQPGNPRASRRGSPQRAGSFGARAARTARLLGRDASATLAAARGEHGTTRPGAHAGAEPVRAGAPTVVRLESALHGVSSLRLGDLGRRALGMVTTGRTDLFLGTKVRNSLRTGQTRVRRAPCPPGPAGPCRRPRHTCAHRS